MNIITANVYEMKSAYIVNIFILPYTYKSDHKMDVKAL